MRSRIRAISTASRTSSRSDHWPMWLDCAPVRRGFAVIVIVRRLSTMDDCSPHGRPSRTPGPSRHTFSRRWLSPTLVSRWWTARKHGSGPTCRRASPSSSMPRAESGHTRAIRAPQTRPPCSPRHCVRPAFRPRSSHGRRPSAFRSSARDAGPETTARRSWTRRRDCGRRRRFGLNGWRATRRRDRCLLVAQRALGLPRVGLLLARVGRG